MPTKIESSPAPKSVRWTDDEWTRIASYLCSKKGTVQLALSTLGEVKAKDVFVAQQVLPVDRHRKLVSIAQGFDGIRTRLSAILQSLPQGSQEDFLQQQPLAYRDEEGEKEKTREVHRPVTGKAGQLQAKVHAREAEGTFRPEQQATYSASETVTVNSAPSRRTGRSTSGVGEPTAEQTLGSNEPLEAKAGSSRQEGLPPHYPPTPSPGSITLMELARPFIEMVYEEFIRAVVNVLSNQGGRHGLQTSTPEARSQRAASTQADFNERQSLIGQLSRELDSTPQSKNSTADNQPQPVSFSGVLADDDPDSDEVEVQPLFDPKLPPSADSDFKPNIGVVASHANDLHDLRQLYPQLNLTIVQADSLPDVRCFGHCQRIIALRDEVSPATDEMLGRLLRHRYVRLGGGISGIKAQLNAWLDAPGSISSSSRRAMPRYGREPVGEMVKKKQNRYPRTIVR